MSEVQLIAKKNVQGYYMNLLLSRAWDGFDYKVHFTDAKDLLSSLKELGRVDFDVLYTVGMPFWDSQQRATVEWLTQRIPNNKQLLLYHFATFGNSFVHVGDSLRVMDYVDELTSPVDWLEEALDHVTAGNSDIALDLTGHKWYLFWHNNADIVRLVGGYNSYNIEVWEKSIDSIDLAEFGMLMRGNLTETLTVTEGLPELYERYKPVFRSLRETRWDAISQAIKRTKATVINSTVICFLYAEQYPNEIAHKLIDFYRQHNYEKVIVFVGKHTKGDDMFSIRSYGVDASEVAYRLNRGKGKPNTATVFLGNSGNATYNAAVQSLSEIL